MEGVFKKVSQNRQQGRPAHAFDGRFGAVVKALDVELQVLVGGAVHQGLENLAQKFREVPGTRVAPEDFRSLARLRACKLQELRDLLDGPLESGLKTSHDGTRFGGQVEAAEVFGLDRERRERRAELVRSIGCEAELARARFTHASEQAVDGLDEGLHLGGNALGRQGREVGGGTLGRGSGGASDRREHAPEREADHDDEDRQKNQNREHGRHGGAAGVDLARRDGIGHGRVAAPGKEEHGHAVGLALDGAGRKAALDGFVEDRAFGASLVVEHAHVDGGARGNKTGRVRIVGSGRRAVGHHVAVHAARAGQGLVGFKSGLELGLRHRERARKHGSEFASGHGDSNVGEPGVLLDEGVLFGALKDDGGGHQGERNRRRGGDRHGSHEDRGAPVCAESAEDAQAAHRDVRRWIIVRRSCRRARASPGRGCFQWPKRRSSCEASGSGIRLHCSRARRPAHRASLRGRASRGWRPVAS